MAGAQRTVPKKIWDFCVSPYLSIKWMRMDCFPVSRVHEPYPYGWVLVHPQWYCCGPYIPIQQNLEKHPILVAAQKPATPFTSLSKGLLVLYNDRKRIRCDCPASVDLCL